MYVDCLSVSSFSCFICSYFIACSKSLLHDYKQIDFHGMRNCSITICVLIQLYCESVAVMMYCDVIGSLFVQGSRKDSAIDSDLGPAIDARATENYRTIKAILQRLTRLCVVDSGTGRKPRKHEQRLLRNMGAHSEILELLEIPYEKVSVSVIMT